MGRFSKNFYAFEKSKYYINIRKLAVILWLIDNFRIGYSTYKNTQITPSTHSRDTAGKETT